MPENKTEEEVNRKERTINNRDTDAIIMTADSKKNMYKERVFDFVELIETSTDGNARKLRNLKQYGITDEMIVFTYKDIAGNVETIETATAALGTIFEKLATYITQLPNGIVIDMATGSIDHEKSFAQAVAVGIYPENSTIEQFIAGLEDITSNLYFDDEKDVDYVLSHTEFSYIGEIGIQEDIDDFLNKDINEMNLSASLKESVSRYRKLILESDYQKDRKLYEISRLEMDIAAAKRSPLQLYWLSKRTEFYEKNPDYIGKVLVRNPDGTINENEAAKVNELRDAYQRMFMLEHIDMFNSMTPEEFANLEREEKGHVIIGAFASFQYKGNDFDEYIEIATESRKMIKQLYPELDFNDKEQLATFWKKEMGFKEELESISLSDLSQISLRQLDASMDKYIEKNTSKSRNMNSNPDFTGLELTGSLQAMHGSAMQNYFVGSNIDFSKSDEKSYNELYQDFTISSWIESKDEAIKLSYMAILNAKENYRKKYGKDNPDINLVKYDNKLKLMEKNFGKIEIDEDMKKGDMPFDVYRQTFINAGLTKYYTRDAIKFQNGASYEQLSRKEKREYIMNTIVGLKYAEGNPNFSISKFALRRLEVMSTDDKKFVEFDENGTPHINKELITEEFQTVLGHKCESYEELQDVAERQKERYFLKKLREYTELDEKDFLKLDDPTDLERSMEQIEDIRLKSNTERIQQKVAEAKKQAEIEEQRNPELIADQDFDKGIEKGILKPVDLTVLARKAKKIVRELRTNDQNENNSDTNNANTESNNTDLKAVDLDSSATGEKNQSEKISFIGIIRQAINNAKDFISRYIGKKEKVKALDKGSNDPVDSTGTSGSSGTQVDETKKLSESEKFNKSLSAGLTLQEQQEYSVRQQMQQAAKNDKDIEEGIEIS